MNTSATLECNGLIVPACCLCADHGKRVVGVAVPVVMVPLKNWPIPGYLVFRGALCREHTVAFSLSTFTDWNGSWYEMFCDDLRAIRKPATNPFPDDPNFKWDEFIITPDWEPAAKSECEVKFWDPGSLAAKGMRQRLWT